jgi:hypothetical protein
MSWASISLGPLANQATKTLAQAERTLVAVERLADEYRKEKALENRISGAEGYR